MNENDGPYSRPQLSTGASFSDPEPTGPLLRTRFERIDARRQHYDADGSDEAAYSAPQTSRSGRWIVK